MRVPWYCAKCDAHYPKMYSTEQGTGGERKRPWN